MTSAQVVQLKHPPMCARCGTKASAGARCDCGVEYISAGEFAAKAIAATPEKSNRAIADETGLGYTTVQRARKKQGDPNGSPEKHTGKDGKKYRATGTTSSKGKPPRRRAASRDACDYDWSKPEPADFGNPTKMYKAQAEHYRTEAAHFAKAYPLLAGGIDAGVVTKSEIQSAQRVADAWLDVVRQLTKIHQPKRKSP